MRFIALALVATAASGCTTLSLERHTLATTNSAMDLRYREVVDNLAIIADNPATLPSYSSIFSGTIQITDSGSIASTTLFSIAKALSGATLSGFTSEALNPQISRNISENWSLDPVFSPEKLEAMRGACQWVLYGPDRVSDHCLHLLASPEQDHSPGRHFGVMDRLARLPVGWLHAGKLKDVPVHAAYKGHCGHIWVWVMPDCMGCLSEFTLILQDIAWVSINSQSLYYYPKPACILERSSEPGRDGKDTDPSRVSIAISVDKDNNPIPVVPFRQVRFDNRGTASELRSQISAAASP